jgi:hypothetical protein
VAIATAEQFVEFCTGRAWVLTDVGATDTEPRYGFTHRTFLEYFASEHLVRTHPTAAQLWGVMRPCVLSGEWEVMAQIALQLLDRNVDGGADELLHLVLAEARANPRDRSRLHGFAARALGYLHPGHDVISEIVTAALHTTLEGDVRDRFHYWLVREIWDTLRARDDALYTVMHHCSPGNLPTVQRILSAILYDRIGLGSETAWLLAFNRYVIGADQRTERIWQGVQQGLCDRHAATLAAWDESTPWKGILLGTEPDRLVARFGPWTLYLRGTVLNFSLPSLAERLLRSGMCLDDTHLDPRRLCETLMVAGRPWISDERWWTELPQPAAEYTIMELTSDISRREGLDAPIALLMLPYLELFAHSGSRSLIFGSAPLLHQLASARQAHSHALSELIPPLEGPEFTEQVRAFLTSWARRKFDVLPPPPSD